MADEKLNRLRDILREYKSCLVAYSGGVDSVLLAHVAHDVLGGKMLAVIADSPSLPRREFTEAREIAELYDADHDFRDHVSRYIHDFEAMLRTLLSTRDGNAISVTLLSSDMGKLYVVLAQALERLRQ